MQKMNIHLWMMFDRHEEEDQTIKELDSIHARDSHVEKDSKEYSKGDQLQH
jgi:hypothetical protein